MRGPSPIGRFALNVFIWLPICFAAWYFFSILHVIPLAWLLDLSMTRLFPQLIAEVQQSGNQVLITTTAIAVDHQVGSGPSGELLFKINPLKYGYGLPFYTALVIASPGSEAGKIGRWMLGMLLLALALAFGVGAETIEILALQVGGEAGNRLGLATLGHELVALAYQFGFLILPSLAPVLIWSVQFQDFLETLRSPSKESE
jgi:hypothetical protein